MVRVARQNLRLPLKGPKSKPSAAVRFGKEEQQRERALAFVKKSEQAAESLLQRATRGPKRGQSSWPGSKQNNAEPKTD